MIRLTNLADYGVVLMCTLAAADKKMSAQDLATSTRIPVATVSKILNLLSRADLLTSHRGLNGGFSLMQDQSSISVANIVEAIDGPIAMTHCVEANNSDCSFDEICVMRPHWRSINDAVRNALLDVKLNTLITSSNYKETDLALAASQS